MNTLNQESFQDVDALREVFAEVKKQRGRRKPAKIMVVEDDPLTRRVVVGILGEVNAMITAQNAKEAVMDYLLHAPDVVFLDIGLPGADGFAVLDHIMLADPNAFVVMFSGNDYPHNVKKAFAAGAKGFISKPFKKESLREYIHGGMAYHRKLYAQERAHG